MVLVRPLLLLLLPTIRKTKVMTKKVKINVCADGKKCAKKGSKAIAEALVEAVAELDKEDRLSVKLCKCMDLCKHGPSIVIMPDKTRYGRVKVSDARAIVEGQLTDKAPLKHLLISKKD